MDSGLHMDYLGLMGQPETHSHADYYRFYKGPPQKQSLKQHVNWQQIDLETKLPMDSQPHQPTDCSHAASPRWAHR